MTKTNKIYLFISLGLVALICLMWFIDNGGEKRKERERRLLTIDTTEIQGVDYEVSKGYIGTLYAAHTFELHSNVNGRVMEIYYDIGDYIENNATVALLDDTSHQLDLKVVEGKLNIEKSKVKQKEMSIALAEKEYHRTLAMRAEKVVSESSLEKAKFNFEQKEMTFDVDKANLEMQETALELSKLKLSYTKIKAHWTENEENGTRVLAERFVEQGAMVNTNTTIATIIDIGLLKAEIFVGEKEYPHFKSGMKVKIEVDAFPNRYFEGTVERLAPFINEQTRQAKVQISVPNPDLLLRPGMFARTGVIFRNRENVQMLPKTCIVSLNNKSGVYLYNSKSKRVSFLPVKIGAVRSGNAEIINASDIDKPVVSVGQHMIRDKELVQHIADKNNENTEEKRITSAKKKSKETK